MNVLVTGVGGPTARGVAVALKRFGGYRPFTLVGTDVNPLAVGLYQPDLFAHACVVPHASDSGYWPTIERIVDEHDIDIAVVLPEIEVLAWGRRAATSRLPCRALIPDPALTELLIDKAGMAAALESHGLAPRSVAFSRNQRVGDIAGRLGWPLWVRYPSGTSGSGSLKVDSADVLRSWIAVNSGAEWFLASTYLPGRNLACTMVYYDGALRRAACAERVRYVMSRVAPSGITGNTSFGRLLHDPGVVRTAASAMDHLFSRSGSARHGVFTVDLKEDGRGRAFVTEVNVRHVAFVQCFAAAGANLPQDALRLVDGDQEFDRSFLAYEFEGDPVFLRDVDVLPVVMKAGRLLD